MKNIEQILKQLKSIEPDSGYTAYSRSDILKRFETSRSNRPILVRTAFRMFQGGSAIALAGVLLLVVAGGFSAWSILRPFGVPALDPAGLRAEAQAIDIQIQLADLEYPEFISAQEDPEAEGLRSSAVTTVVSPEEAETSTPLKSPASSTPTVQDVLMLLIEE